MTRSQRIPRSVSFSMCHNKQYELVAERAWCLSAAEGRFDGLRTCEGPSARPIEVEVEVGVEDEDRRVYEIGTAPALSRRDT